MDEPARPLALVDLLCALAAGALWYVRPELGPWPLLLILLGLIVRYLVEPQPEFSLSGLDAAVALFAVSAVIGLVIAYDWTKALPKFWVIIGGVALYGSLVRAPEKVAIGRRAISPVVVLLALLPALVAAYFVATADYSQLVGKLAVLDGVFRWIGTWQPDLPGHKLHPNVAAGLIAALVPLALLAVWGRRERYVLAAICAVALILSASRGAWAALAVVGIVWAGVAVVRSGRRSLMAAAGVAAIALIILAVVLAPTITAQGGNSTQQGAPTSAADGTGLAGGDLPADGGTGEDDFPSGMQNAVEGRSSLLGNSLALAWDYAFTGLGLAGFQMAYSSYVLLLHVGHTFHSHNVFVNVWLEQGLLGILALGWLLVAAVVAAWRVWRTSDREGRLWAAAALASLAVLCLHGLVDDAFYGSRGVLLMFVPFAVLAREQSRALAEADEEPPTLLEVLGSRQGLILAAALIGILLIGLLPPVRSQWQANLGALSQTRAELAIYEWPQWSIQDELRRANGLNLGPAVDHYRKALALDGSNATANRRLGQIALSLGDYADAGPLLAAAYRSGYTNRATRQMYGEWLAMNGQAAEAAALWRKIDLGQGQLAARTWWYEHVGDAGLAAGLRTAEQMR